VTQNFDGHPFAFPARAYAAEGEAAHPSVGATLLAIVVLLLAGKLAGLVEKVGQPAVRGELVAGVMLGNLSNLQPPISNFQFPNPKEEQT